MGWAVSKLIFLLSKYIQKKSEFHLQSSIIENYFYAHAVFVQRFDLIMMTPAGESKLRDNYKTTSLRSLKTSMLNNVLSVITVLLDGKISLF